MDPVGESSRRESGPSPFAERGTLSSGGSGWDRVDGMFERMEQTLLIFFLGFIILIAFLQIALRNFFFTGIDWGDSLVRNLVLWIGFIGATLATKEDKHINIDVVSRWLPSLGKNMVALIAHLFSFCICGLLTYATIKFIKNEFQMENLTFLDIPAWVPELILPLTFILMTFRFGLRSFRTFSEMRRTNLPREREKEA